MCHKDIGALYHWNLEWKLLLYTSKCSKVLTITVTCHVKQSSDIRMVIHFETPTCRESKSADSGVTVAGIVSWNSHVREMIFFFVGNRAPQAVKPQLYISLLRCHFEYYSP